MSNVSDFYLDHRSGNAYVEYDDGSTASKNIVTDTISRKLIGSQYFLDDESRKVTGDSLGVRHIKSGSGDVEIMEAHQWLLDRFERATLSFDPYGTYTIGDTVTIDVGVCSISGNRAIWNAPSLSAGKFALSLTNNKNGEVGAASGFGRYGLPAEISNLDIKGSSVTGRDNTAKGIRLHTDTIGSSVLVSLRNVRASNFNTGISVGSRAYFLRGYNTSVHGCSVCLLQEAGASDFSENIAFFGGSFFNSDGLVKTLSGQQFRFYGVSFDYFGDPTGFRTTAEDYAFNIQAGGLVELYGCHIEFDYGRYAGQTNSPITLSGANSRFVMHGGFLGTLNTIQQPLYKAPISTNNGSQVVVMRDVRVQGLGRKSQPTNDDQLVCGANADNTGVVAQVQIENLIPYTFAQTDLPSCIGYSPGANMYRNGVDAPHTELNIRTSVTGTAAISSVSTTDGSVTARNSVGSMMKITGQGKVNITLPSLRADRRTAWSMFLNTSQAAGTVTVKQRDTTVAWKWDGASALTPTAVARNAYSSATESITCGGTNQFERVSWKDAHSDVGWSVRMGSGPVFCIEIDTTGMTSGAIYLDDFTMGQM